MDILGMFQNFNPGEVVNWMNALFFIFGLLTNPEKLAKNIVEVLKRVVPPPFKKPLLQFINQISKGFDKAIPDEVKEKQV